MKAADPSAPVNHSSSNITMTAISKSVTGVPIAKADGIDATDTICTVSPIGKRSPLWNQDMISVYGRSVRIRYIVSA